MVIIFGASRRRNRRSKGAPNGLKTKIKLVNGRNPSSKTHIIIDDLTPYPSSQNLYLLTIKFSARSDHYQEMAHLPYNLLLKGRRRLPCFFDLSEIYRINISTDANVKDTLALGLSNALLIAS